MPKLVLAIAAAIETGEEAACSTAAGNELGVAGIIEVTSKHFFLLRNSSGKPFSPSPGIAYLADAWGLSGVRP